MKTIFAATMLTAMLSGCMEQSVEEIEITSTGWRRSMWRGTVQHGWSVENTPDGSQLWTQAIDGIHVASLVITPNGQVSDAWYEDDDYMMIMKHYAPGQPLGRAALHVLDDVQREAERRRITIPAVSTTISSPVLADSLPQTPSALAIQ